MSHQPRGGFALIIALSLMALILLLVLSLSVLTRMEIKASTTQQEYNKARLIALVGLNEALGQLQAEAGPDRRATAKLDLLPEITSEALRDWTGVWIPPSEEAFAENANAQPTIRALTSLPEEFEDLTDIVALQTAVNGLNASDFVSIAQLKDLDGESGINREVRIPLVSVDGSQSANKRFGYWVDDESLKIKVMPRIQPPSDYWHVVESPNVSILPVFADDKLNQGLENLILGNHQLPNLTTPATPDLAHSERFTSHGYGVLANARIGGLRRDLPGWLRSLSSAELDNLDAKLFTGSQEDVSLRRLIDYFDLVESVNADSDTVPIVEVRPQSAEEAGIYPILTTVQMGWGVGVNSSGRLLLTMRPVVVVANPHNVRLEETDYIVQRTFLEPTSSGKTNIEIYYRASLPTDDDGDYSLADDMRSFELDDFTGDRLDAGSNELRENAPLLFRLPNVSFEPGEIKIFTYAQSAPAEYDDTNGVALNSTYDRDRSYIYMDVGPNTGITSANAVAVRAEFAFLHSNGFSNFTLFRDDNGDNHRLQKIGYSHSLMSTNVDKANLSYIDYPQSLDASADRHNLKRSDWEWNTINNSSWSRDRNGIRFLADYNPRAHFLFGQGYWQSSNYPSNSNIPGEGTNPLWTSEGNDPGNFEVNHDLATDRGFWGPDDATESFVSLFHLPRGILYSIGELQHADLSGHALQPAYQVGNSLASPYFAHSEEDLSWRLNNWLWDDFHLGAFDVGELRSANPRLVGRDGGLDTSELESRLANPEQQGAHLLIDGSFNVNTTQHDAWRTQLASLRHRAMAYYDTTSESLADAVESPLMLPRLPLPGGSEGELWRGFRAMSERQINDLADAIVSRIRERGPFLSLAEFVNRDLNAVEDNDENLRGLLADAIHELDKSGNPFNHEVDFSGNPGNRVDEGIDVPYPGAAVGPRSTHAPGWLSQADILQALGPILTVRGDTFVIRSYGESLNSAAGTSRAWCEAVVQRVPNYVDANNRPWTDINELSNTNELMGRRFQIVSFRWLNANEI